MSRTEKKILVLCLGVLFASIHVKGLVEAMGPEFRAGKNDFTAFYLGARLSGTGHLFDAAEQHGWQRVLFGDTRPAVTFIRLPFYAWLLRPLGWLEYGVAWKVFLGLNVLCAFWFFLRLLTTDLAVFLLGLAFLPTYAALMNGQDVWFTVLLFVLAVRLAEEGRDWRAGLTLSLCAIKPHLFVFVPLALALQRRWRFLAAGVAGAVLLLALCFLAEGPDWIQPFVATLKDPRVHPRTELMPTLPGLATAAGVSPWAGWVLAVPVILAVIRISLRGSLEAGLAAALVAGILVNRHAYLADTVLLLPALALLRRQGLEGRPFWIWAFAVSPVPCVLFVYGWPYSALLPVAMVCALTALLGGSLRAWPPEKMSAEERG